ncbi:sporulation initiation phosphotransferase B [Bacillus infantis]|uniref:Sporulation protein n=1 Tax=Bacillus infantis TaxID=324767 RepID=A0A5D4RNB8_9BACI|nr:sporulation initiation phosphotransferase B [Bacillus infantis]MCA1038963.1 sporulation initiation phosphotransferase B [Bacillus infantis]TYS51296.1 sporulation protein [Bacillus infantis]
MEKDWSTVEVLRHARHDWMNKIQLIKGNLSLSKYDRAKEIIDEIVVEAQNEAKLSNLNIPQFASLLFTYNWENHSFQIDYEVLDDVKCRKLDDQFLESWTRSFFARLDDSVKPFHDNHLSVLIEPQEDGIRLFFDFSGIITERESIRSYLGEQHQAIRMKMEELSEQELALEVFMPFSRGLE